MTPAELREAFRVCLRWYERAGEYGEMCAAALARCDWDAAERYARYAAHFANPLLRAKYEAR